MLPRINNYIFPDEPIYHRWWWNCMRSSCWNAPAVLVLLGLIGGVCWASHGHTGLASDPKQLLSRQGLQLRMPNPKPCYSPGRHFWKTLLWPLKGLDPAVKALWRILLGKAPVFSWSDFGVSYFQQTNIPLCLQHTNAEFTDNCSRKNCHIFLNFYKHWTQWLIFLADFVFLVLYNWNVVAPSIWALYRKMKKLFPAIFH